MGPISPPVTTEPGFVTVSEQSPFFYAKGDKIHGPHPIGEIPGWLEDKILAPEDLMWMKGWDDWQPVGEAFDFSEATGEGTPALASDPPAAGKMEVHLFTPTSDGLSDRLGKGVLAAFLVHLVLLITAMWLVTLHYQKKISPPVATHPDLPPMEVALVTEDETTPPPPSPQPMARAAAPIDLPPPPPPAPPVIPVLTPPPALAPAVVPDSAVPAPQETSLPAQKPAVIAKLKTTPVKLVPPARVPAPVPSPVPVPTPSSTEARAAEPSDYLDAPQLQYPSLARQQRQTGTVLLRVTIDDAGNPIDVEIAQSSGYSILDRSAQRQVRDLYRFKVGSSRVLLVPTLFQLDP